MCYDLKYFDIYLLTYHINFFKRKIKLLSIYISSKKLTNCVNIDFFTIFLNIGNLKLINTYMLARSNQYNVLFILSLIFDEFSICLSYYLIMGVQYWYCSNEFITQENFGLHLVVHLKMVDAVSLYCQSLIRDL